MSLEKQIEAEIITGIKSKDSNKVQTLRMVKAALTNYKIEKKSEDLTDEDVQQVLQKQAKQRRESIASYDKAGRTDLAQKEKDELVILESYLPKQLSDEELTEIIKSSVEEAGAISKTQMGQVMKIVMPKIKGKADGKRVNAILAQLLK